MRSDERWAESLRWGALLALTLAPLLAVGWIGAAQKDVSELLSFLAGCLASAGLVVAGLLWLRRGRR
jgi:hypothetical protein